jgi:hypothetical protein
MSATLAIYRQGSCRFTVCAGPWALKIARNSTGRRCNRYEANLWKTTTDARRAFLCPVLTLLPFGWGLIMRRAVPLSEEEADRLLAADAYPDWDYMPPDDEGHPFEYKASDWGRLPDGRLVALDYSAHALSDPVELELAMQQALRRMDDASE